MNGLGSNWSGFQPKVCSHAPLSFLKYPSKPQVATRSLMSSKWRALSASLRSAAFCSEMSRAIVETPVTAPRWSRIGETVSAMSIRRQSLRILTVSKFSISLARADSLEQFRHLALMLRRDEHVERAADHLLRVVAVDPLGAAVPAGDDPVQPPADHRIGGAVDDRGELAPRAVGHHPLADVADRAGEVGAPVDLPVDERERDRELLAVAAQPDQLHGLADHPALAGLDEPPQPRLVRGPEALRHQHPDLAADRLGRRVAEQPLGGGVDVGDPPVLVAGDDRLDRVPPSPPGRSAR